MAPTASGTVERNLNCDCDAWRDFSEIADVLAHEAGHLHRQWLIGQRALEVGELSVGSGWCAEAAAALGRLMLVAVHDLGDAQTTALAAEPSPATC